MNIDWEPLARKASAIMDDRQKASEKNHEQRAREILTGRLSWLIEFFNGEGGNLVFDLLRYAKVLNESLPREERIPQEIILWNKYPHMIALCSDGIVHTTFGFDVAPGINWIPRFVKRIQRVEKMSSMSLVAFLDSRKANLTERVFHAKIGSVATLLLDKLSA